MREYCEKEMSAWGFPNHKYQKTLSNHELKKTFKEVFGMSDLKIPGHSHISDLTIA